MPGLDEDTNARLLRTNWNEVGRVLVAHAVWVAKAYRWRAAPSTIVAIGKGPEDFAMDVVRRVLSGDAEWDPERGDLLPFLKVLVKNDMLNAMTSAAGKHERAFAPGDPRCSVGRAAERPQDVGPENPAPDELLVSVEDDEAASAQIDALFAASASDAELEDLLMQIMEGTEPKPRHLARALGTTVQDVNNRLKRLRRRALEIEA